jgi:hypothetical protein
MNRTELQIISRLRVREARQLLDGGYFVGSYYLLGYAVECAIKSCIAKETQRFDFPDKGRVTDSHVHNLEKLLQVAGLWQPLMNDIRTNPSLSSNWAVVKDWKETYRYQATLPESQARDFYSACTAKKHGILSWIKKSW